jgi:HEAT repeat protein
MAVDDLKEMLKEEDEYLRKAAGEALGKITAKPKMPP